jgi:hypothetical protein
MTLLRTDTDSTRQQAVVTVRLYFASTVCKELAIDCTELATHNTVYSVDAARLVIFKCDTFFPDTLELHADMDEIITASTDVGSAYAAET